MISLAVPVFLVLIGMIFLYKRGTIPMIGAGIFLVIGVYLGTTATGDFLRTLLGELAGLVS
jgi:surface polysaccharide O-acyltransferase-like enzyme